MSRRPIPCGRPKVRPASFERTHLPRSARVDDMRHSAAKGVDGAVCVCPLIAPRSAFWSGEGSLVTRLEFVRIGSYHRWGVCRRCDSDVCHRCATGPRPEGSRAGAWALDLRRREWGRSRSNHDRRIQVPDVPQMCHMPLLSDDFGRPGSDCNPVTCGNTSGEGRT